MSTVAIFVGAVVVLYVGLCVLLYLKQEDFLFVRVANDAALADAWSARRVQIPAGHFEIEGWWAEGGADNNLTIIYFGGNAEDVLYSATAAKHLHASRFLATNYRGYGQTPGQPSETGILSDALAVYDYTLRQPGADANNIVVMGRSLGSGVATYVAANRSVRGAVLVTPYDSMSAVAQHHYPYFPVALLLKHRFPSADLAKNIRTPAVFVSAEHDEVIPAVYTMRLFEAWRGPKQSVMLQHAGHNDVDGHDEYFVRINEFLDSLLKKQP